MWNSSLACSSLACNELIEFKWWTLPINQFLKPYLFVLCTDDSLYVHPLAPSSLSQSLGASSTASCNLIMGILAGKNWFHFRGLGSMMACSFCCAIRLHNSKYVVLLYYWETFYGATFSGDCRHNERYRKPCENQRLKGLKFPSAISLLHFPREYQSLWGLFKAYTWL